VFKVFTGLINPFKVFCLYLLIEGICCLFSRHYLLVLQPFNTLPMVLIRTMYTNSLSTNQKVRKDVVYTKVFLLYYVLITFCITQQK